MFIIIQWWGGSGRVIGNTVSARLQITRERAIFLGKTNVSRKSYAFIRGNSSKTKRVFIIIAVARIRCFTHELRGYPRVKSFNSIVNN